MARLPDPTIDAIYQTYVNARTKEPPRDYLGGSEIGEECCRRLWYSFRKVGQAVFEGRMLRLFDTGKREEDRIIADLRAAGVEVSAPTPQWRFTACNGHFSIGLDGTCLGLLEAPKTWHVLECKTHNLKSFDDLEKNGVEKSKPQHFAQCQVGMGLAELDRAVYIAQCKNDDRLYLERLDFEPPTFKALMLKSQRIIDSDSAPDRIGKDASFFKCKFCPFVDNCHGDKRPEIHCKTCIHSKPVADGKWSCEKSMPMEPDCHEHILIPSLLHWAEPIDGTPEWILYKMTDGRQFLNCSGTGFPAMDVPHYSSSELAAIPVTAIGNPAVEMAREILGGKVIRG
jgi:hypothetical protein